MSGASSPRTDRWMAGGVGAVIWLVYVRTLFPDITGGDSGELVVVSTIGGVLHPPGFPLYSLLARLFSHLPVGTLAWRFNLFSATCDAFAAALLFLAVSRWSGRRSAGIVCAGLFAFAPGVWLYAISAEVFALNNLFVAALLLLTVLYTETLDRRFAYAGALTLGLGLSNHHVLIFTGAPLVAWVLWTGRKDLVQPHPLMTLVVLTLVGLVPYFELPLAAGRHAAISWGAPDTWDGFGAHVFREDYGTLSLAAASAPDASQRLQTLAEWAGYALDQLGWWGLGLAALGFASSIVARRRGWGLAATVAVPPVLSVGVFTVLANIPVQHALERTVLDRFWQQPHIYFAIWCGLGLTAVTTLARRPRILPIAAIASVLLQFGLHAGAMDRHSSTLLRDSAAEILRVAPPAALIIANGDTLPNILAYQQLAAHQRPDVRVLDEGLLTMGWENELVRAHAPEITLPGARYSHAQDGYTMRAFFEANQRFPIVVCGGLAPGDDSTEGAFEPWPLGLCERYVRAGSEVDLASWITSSESALPRLDFTGQPHPPGSWEDSVWQQYRQARLARALKLFQIARRPRQVRFLAVASRLVEDMERDQLQPPPALFKALAAAMAPAPESSAEELHETAAAWRRYLATNPTYDPDVPRIKEEVERLSR